MKQLRCGVIAKFESVYDVKTDLRLPVYGTLAGAGVEVPFQQRDIQIEGAGRLIQTLAESSRASGMDKTAQKADPDPS